MRIIKCDLCKENIKKEPITAGIGFFPKAELCEKCGAPILKFLKNYKNPSLRSGTLNAFGVF